MGCVLQKSKSQTLESVMCVDILKMCEDQCIQICMWSHSYPWLPTILSQNIPLLFSRVLLSLLRVTGRYSLHHARYQSCCSPSNMYHLYSESNRSHICCRLLQNSTKFSCSYQQLSHHSGREDNSWNSKLSTKFIILEPPINEEVHKALAPSQ